MKSALFCFLRRGRDSNPRYLSVRRFSRPVQSTTLPPLQRFFVSRNVVFPFLTLQKYIKIRTHASVWAKKLKNISLIYQIFIPPTSEQTKKSAIKDGLSHFRRGIINSYSSLPRSMPEDASMQGKSQEHRYL